MGEPPEDYKLFLAAKYCNCAPWELQEQSIVWTYKALDYMSGEAEGQEILEQHQPKG